MTDKPTKYSLILKRKRAHEYSIFCCDWKRLVIDPKIEPTPPSKEILVTSGIDAVIKVWQFNGEELLPMHEIESKNLAITSLSLTSDAFTLASSSLDGVCTIWDLESGCKVHDLKTGLKDSWRITISPDNMKIAGGGQTGDVNVYSIRSGELENVLDTRGKFIYSIAWSPSGGQIACGAEDGRVTILDAQQRRVTHTFQYHMDPILNAKYSPDSKVILVTSKNKVMLYNAFNGLEIGSEYVLDSNVVTAEISPNGRNFAAGCVDGSVRIFKIKEQKCAHKFTDHSNAVCAIKYSPEGNMIMSVSKDSCINIYECPLNNK